jgi:carboxymethylenebutenolidase
MTKTTLLSVFVLLSSTLVFADGIPPANEGAAAALSKSSRHGEWVDIAMDDGTKIKSFVVYPERKDKAPVVLVIHEIFGMSDWVRSVADQLAAEGFIAVAPDFLSGMGPNGGGTESLGDQVGQTIRKITPELQAKRLDAVREYAIKLPSATGKSGSVGFCWGGSASFSYATRQPALNAAVAFYGTAPMTNNVPDKTLLEKIQCPVLGLYGGSDNRVTSTVDATDKAMTELKKNYVHHVYDGAGHGFMRQQNAADSPNHKAAEQGWAEAIAFLKKNLE